ncbi:MAG: 3-phosphoshikimate 1-carboxyvinyltransferase [Chlamydiae bacterium]|nr:3-phosphoshikimate 1-carboxyvinyltransferase [Chlamydiota bacterium]
MQLLIQQTRAPRVQDTIKIPPSKSHTQRALLFALMGHGISTVTNYLSSPDVEHMVIAIELLGAKILYRDPYTLQILGVGGKLQPAHDVIFAGNSGQILRFLGAFSSLLPTYTVLTGDISIRTNRPVTPLLSGIQQLGGFAVSANLNGTAPIIIRGPISPGTIEIDGACSQAVSGLLMACSFLSGKTHIRVRNAGEKPWLRLTLSWLDFLGLPYKEENLEYFVVEGNGQYKGFSYTVPGDLSSAAFPLTAAILTNTPLALHSFDRTSYQGDDKLVDILQSMGASLFYHHEEKTLFVRTCSSLQGGVIQANDCIDAVPILCVIGCMCTSPLTLKDIGIARRKESDRLSCMTKELRKMGARIEEKEDSLTIYPSLLQGADLYSHHDHRIAMALSIAGLCAKGDSLITECNCIEKSYPHYVQDLSALGFPIFSLP